MKNLIVAGLCAASSVIAAGQASQCSQNSCENTYFYQGDLPLCSAAAAYNLPAAVAIPCQWGVFLDASYTYWYAGQGGMDVASTAVLVGGTVVPPNGVANIGFPSFEYSSGFKVGLGVMPRVDDWILRADYTYVRQHLDSSFTAPSQSNGTGVLFMTSWFYQSSDTLQPLACSSLSSDWMLGIDWLDASLSRPYYMGRNWTVAPFGGLRSSWIRQSYRIELGELLNAAGPDSLASSNRSQNWGIGPRAGVEWHWLTASRFRFEGAFGASLIYTKYTTLTHKEDPLTSRTDPVISSLQDPTFLQPMAEASLGMGWCVYAGQTARVDFSATYDFNMLWNQNMMRSLNDTFIAGVSPASNNLFLHGLTVNVRGDF